MRNPAPHRPTAAEAIDISVCLLLVACLPGIAAAQSDADIDRLTEPVRARADAESLSTAYAAIINFAVSPEISTATFYPETDETVVDPRLKATRFPYRKVFGTDGDVWRPLLQALAAYQEMDAGFQVTADDFIDTRWKTYGLSLAGGVQRAVTANLDLLATANVGFGRLENVVAYRGPLRPELKQALDGVVFDWELDAVIYGGGAGAHYRRSTGSTSLDLRAGLSHHRIESHAASSSYVEFSSHVTTLDLDIKTVTPTRLRLGQYPLAAVGILGFTTFVGRERDALGFGEFAEAGLAVDIDLSARDWRLKKLRIGATAIFGPEVHGWGLIIGPGF